VAGFDDLRASIQTDIFAGMPAHLGRLTWSAGRLHDWQRDRLRALLAVAMRRSPCYARRLAGVEPERFDLAELPSLPVLTKAELMARFDEISCDPLLNRAAAERALAETTTQPRPLPGGYLCMATGGSSGQRGIFAYDKAGVAEFASLIFRARLAALGADRARVPEISFAMVGAPSPVHGTMFIPSMLAGSPIRFSRRW
jgi:phenylacetate-CoA ligase